MILHMIQLEPEARLSAESYLQNYANVVFPAYFSPFLHNFYCCWNPLHSDMRVSNSVIPWKFECPCCYKYSHMLAALLSGCNVPECFP